VEKSLVGDEENEDNNDDMMVDLRKMWMMMKT
jgi:hypothetical protein